jgi:hypothetical protein
MKSRMERVLIDSMLRGTAIGIKLRSSSVLIATAVISLDMFNGQDNWVEIKPYTLYGSRVKETIIHLSQIESVIPFTVQYDDPVYVRLRQLRSKITDLG